MKDIAIYGAGGLGREVACIIKKINDIKPTWNNIGFFDDGIKMGERNEYGSILGGLAELNSWQNELSICMAIANPQTVKRLVSGIINEKIHYPNIISPDLTFMDENNYSMGIGNFINFRCSISCNVHIGNFNTVGAFSSFGHDSNMGDFNTIMPSVQICGNVKINECNFFGISSIVLQQLFIGSNNTIGCNSVLMKNIQDSETYFGNPARAILKKK
jgi:sugar O-acyltransferase (sialic acid O-acetyltransferase NeuD family)